MTLSLRDVSLRVRDGRSERAVLEAVTVEFAPKTVTALAGPSGSGKTSLLSIAAGLLTPTSGDVLLDGRSLVHLRERARARLRRSDFGLVLQDLALVPTLTALENVLLPRVPDGVRREDADRALALLADRGLADVAHQRAAVLSGGERQRVAMARAMLHRPRILLLDEPSASVDAAATERLMADLLALRDEHSAAIVVATHDPRILDDARVDRSLRLAQGRLAIEPS